jgi:hypothetical protein
MSAMGTLVASQPNFKLLFLPFAFFAHAKTLVLAETLWMEKTLAGCWQLFAAGTALTVPLTHSDSFPHSCSVVQVWPYIYYTYLVVGARGAEPGWRFGFSVLDSQPAGAGQHEFTSFRMADSTQGRAQKSLDNLRSVDKIQIGKRHSRNFPRKLHGRPACTSKRT